ncbi:hypothetical protein ABVK25_010964 [Lepraria finkii]|uniref:Uncharacterized protein n=1 Tax=Lepraria finkii TaxID=1340010 RepID=A0ABR4AV69_9LECA
MCIGTLHIHQECLHQKKFAPIETCRSYSEKEDYCAGQCTVVQAVIMSAPKLCVTCFRRVEDDIFNRHKSAIRAVEREIRNTSDSLSGRMPSKRREDIEDHHSRLEEEVGLFKQLRMEEIAEFRAKQGVFADG